MGKMTKEEIEQFDELYNYVKKNVLKYDENQALSSYMVGRLKGVSCGQFIANNRSDKKANYKYKIILYTFKYCKSDIDKYIMCNNTKFSNEQHKFNGIIKIVESKVNDVYEKLNKKAKAKKSIDNSKLNSQNNEFLYKNKSVDKIADKFKDIL